MLDTHSDDFVESTPVRKNRGRPTLQESLLKKGFQGIEQHLVRQTKRKPEEDAVPDTPTEAKKTKTIINESSDSEEEGEKTLTPNTSPVMSPKGQTPESGDLGSIRKGIQDLLNRAENEDKRREEAQKQLKKDMNSIFERLKSIEEANEKEKEERKKDKESIEKKLEEREQAMNERMEKIEKEREDMRKLQAETIKKMKKMQDLMDKSERVELACNLIVSGLEIHSENGIDEVKALLQNKLQLQVTPASATQLQRGRILIKIDSREDKMLIMKNKAKLKGTNIYIDTDLTFKDRDIQSQIKVRKDAEKAAGKRVRMMYKKLIIDGVMYKWDEDREQLFPAPGARQ